MQDFFVILTTFLIVSIFIRFLRKKSDETLQKEDGGYYLRFDKSIYIMGCIFFLLSIIIYLSLYFFTEIDRQFYTGVTVVTLCFTIPSLYLLSFKRVYIFFSEDRIISRGNFCRIIEINWFDIIDIDFNRLGSMSLILKTYNDKVEISFLLIGYNEFIKMMKKKLDTELVNKYEAKLDILKSRRPEYFN